MRKIRRTWCVVAAMVLWGARAGAAEGLPPKAREELRAALAAAQAACDQGNLTEARERLEAATSVVKGEVSSRFWAAIKALDFGRAGQVMNWVLVAWIAVGLLGQGIFTARFVVQWWASEKQGRSVVPVSFWYLSIAGSLLVLSYAFYRLDPVFILAYGFNSFVYVRNLMLIFRSRQRAKQ